MSEEQPNYPRVGTDKVVEVLDKWLAGKVEFGPCPFCGTPDPFRDDHIAQASDRDPRDGRTVTCRESTCQVGMFRARCWYDEAHTRLETTEELDAALAKRWNRRPVSSASVVELLVRLAELKAAEAVLDDDRRGMVFVRGEPVDPERSRINFCCYAMLSAEIRAVRASIREALT